jgi:outer membrane protein assembly factor BamB
MADRRQSHQAEGGALKAGGGIQHSAFSTEHSGPVPLPPSPFRRPFSPVRLPKVGWPAALVMLLCGTWACAEDWPTYRHDMARSGITSEKLSPPLELCWVVKPRYAPQPAWGDPKPGPVEDILELRRVHFDDVFQPVAAGGAVYFGSSADNKVYCLDATTGRIRWSAITGGPVRLAPMVVDGRVYVGSDDGYAYCLRAEDGVVLWKFRAAPEDRRVLGHGKMISLWPLRTGVLVDGGVAYFSAGIFPAEGIFLYAVRAGDGREIWRNDTCGEEPQSHISPQGYLLASKANLYVPMGRVSPAKFDRRDGRLAQDSPFFGKTVGGTYALLAGGDVYTGTEEMVGYHSQSRDRFATFAGRKMVVTADTAYLASNTALKALDRKSAKVQGERWETPCPCADSLILAGNVLFAGGAGQVMAIDATSGEKIWTGPIEGIAKGLAAADGRLLVSTDKGLIYSFGPKGSAASGPVTEPPKEDPFAGSPTSAVFREAAETILKETGIRRGYCVVLGLETGQLALELARRSELMIYAVSPQVDKVAAAQKALDAAGVYGARICVEHWPLEKIPYSDYFANLIVSETVMVTGEMPGDPSEMFRMLKPVGGTAMLGQPSEEAAGGQRAASAVKPFRVRSIVRWLKRGKLEGVQSVRITGEGGRWIKIVRGPLPGAGSWTHEYADTGNTACGDDQRVKCPLGVLWFGQPGPGQMVNRHDRAAAPLSLDGRLFVQGENTVMAYDAYNGLKLWQRDIPGAIRVQASHDSSNLALSRDGLFVAVGDKCLRLDPATGQTNATYPLPPAPDGKPRRWGYIACADSLLFGSGGVRSNTSDYVFALDVQTANTRWVYRGTRIPNNAIAIGNGKFFLASSDVSEAQRREVTEGRREKIQQPPQPERAKAAVALPAGQPSAGANPRSKPDVRRVVALDEKTGQVRWEKAVDLTDCGGWHAAEKNYSAPLAMMYNHGVLVFFGIYLDGHHWKEFFAGQFDSRRITALSGEDGSLLWSRQVGFRVRPLVIGDTLHAEPWAFDLHTGQPKTRVNPITGETGRWQFARPGHHCGCPCASPNCMFFRSYNLGYYDLLGDYGTMHFGAHRPGCWINFIPAGGLLLVPEASAGCMCPFPNMCSVVFQPTDKAKAWAVYSADGPLTPVRRLAINLGAPGDRKDAAGQLWLGYPRPFQGRLVLPLDVQTTFYRGGRFVRENSVYTPYSGTDDPWLFASAARGLQRCVIPLVSEADGTAVYRVGLAFADPENDQPGRRVFDIRLQGKLVAENLDLVQAAGGRNRALLKEFDGVEVSDKLEIELVPKADPQTNLPPAPATPRTAEQLPILQGIEIVRRRVLTLGCTTPEFELSSLAPKQSAQVAIANLREEPVAGTLQMVAPKGFDVSPRQAEIKLAAGQRMAIPVTATVTGDVPPGKYEVSVRLANSDGKLELERTARIEYLGRRGRLVIHPVEDAYVSHRYPDRNQGSANVLLVDGGDQKMGDSDHNLAYLKFRLDVPGRPLSARLRIHNAGNPTADSGRICLVTDPWNEKTVTYRNRPKVGRQLARLGRVTENQVVECPLAVDLHGRTELSLVIDPTSIDGVDYLPRESNQPPELIVEYEP